MDDIRYNPPKSAVADIDPAAAIVMPDAVLKKIRNAWIACLVSAGVTLVISIMAIAGHRVGPFTGAELVDVVLILGLAFGISRKSRVCAVLMFCYFAISKIMLITSTGQVNGLFMGLAFLWFYALGVQGTFEYHKLRKR
ncbi:MAG: hypothetical protein ABIR54_13890 [Burkholderiaceae bacterium]